MLGSIRRRFIAAGLAALVGVSAGQVNAKIVAVHFDELSLCDSGPGWIVLAINEECGTVESTVLCDGG